MDLSDPRLEFDRVTIVSDGLYDTGLTGTSFTLMAGELLLIKLEDENRNLPLADVAVGVIEPEEGCVRFRGRDWRQMSPEQAAAERGRVGRVFEGARWFSSRDVSENIMLAQMHHTRRPEGKVLKEASDLALLFGLPGLPLGRPAAIRRQDLVRAACVRAFMGRPDLVILERPTVGVFAEVHSPLLNVLRSVRERGGAAIWLTDEPKVWEHAAVRPTFRVQMFGGRMRLTKEQE